MTSKGKGRSKKRRREEEWRREREIGNKGKRPARRHATEGGKEGEEAQKEWQGKSKSNQKSKKQ